MIPNLRNGGRPETCQNCKRWKPGTWTSRKDGRAINGTCQLTGESTGRFGSCPRIELKFTPPDYAAVQREAAARRQAVCEWRQQHGPNGPLDEDAVRARAAEILRNSRPCLSVSS